MLKIVANRGYNHAQHDYEKKFKEKIEAFSSLPNYSALEKFAQQCIDLHCADSLDGISARVYMDRVIATPHEDLMGWARNYHTA